MISLEQKINMLENRMARANLHWSFIFTINLAITGWAITTSEKIDISNIYMLLIVLLLAYIFIFIALIRSQSEMIALEKDIIVDIKQEKKESHYYEYLSTQRFKNIKIITWPVYWIGNLAVMIYLYTTI